MFYNYLIAVVCDKGHTQNLHMDGLLGPEWANQMAKLLDGSSRFYLDKPGRKESVVTRCCVCGSPIHSSVIRGEARAGWAEQRFG